MRQARRQPRLRAQVVEASFSRLCVALQRRASADQVPVAINIVHPLDRRPIFRRRAPRPSGNAAASRLYGCAHSLPATSASVCGAFFSGLSDSVQPAPTATAAISARIAIIASQNRSISAWPSLSVGSTISVPATGQLIVGAWNPKSCSRLAMSSTPTPDLGLEPAAIQDAFMRHQPGRIRIQDREMLPQPRRDVVGVQDRHLRRPLQPGRTHHPDIGVGNRQDPRAAERRRRHRPIPGRGPRIVARRMVRQMRRQMRRHPDRPHAQVRHRHAGCRTSCAN